MLKEKNRPPPKSAPGDQTTSEIGQALAAVKLESRNQEMRSGAVCEKQNESFVNAAS